MTMNNAIRPRRCPTNVWAVLIVHAHFWTKHNEKKVPRKVIKENIHSVLSEFVFTIPAKSKKSVTICFLFFFFVLLPGSWNAQVSVTLLILSVYVLSSYLGAMNLRWFCFSCYSACRYSVLSASFRASFLTQCTLHSLGFFLRAQRREFAHKAVTEFCLWQN